MGNSPWLNPFMDKDTPERAALSRNLAELMARKQMSQPELARLSGVGQSTISRMLKKQSAATIDNVAAVARVFRISPWKLLLTGQEVAINPHTTLLDSETLDLATRIQNLSAKDREAMMQTLAAWTNSREMPPQQTPARRASDGPSFGRGGPLQTVAGKEIQTDATKPESRSKTKYPHSS